MKSVHDSIMAAMFGTKKWLDGFDWEDHKHTDRKKMIDRWLWICPLWQFSYQAAKRPPFGSITSPLRFFLFYLLADWENKSRTEEKAVSHCQFCSGLLPMLQSDPMKRRRSSGPVAPNRPAVSEGVPVSAQDSQKTLLPFSTFTRFLSNFHSSALPPISPGWV